MTRRVVTHVSQAARPTVDAAVSGLPPDETFTIECARVTSALLELDFEVTVDGGVTTVNRDGLTVQFPKSVQLHRFRDFNFTGQKAEVDYRIAELESYWDEDGVDPTRVWLVQSVFVNEIGDPDESPSVPFGAPLIGATFDDSGDPDITHLWVVTEAESERMSAVVTLAPVDAGDAKKGLVSDALQAMVRAASTAMKERPQVVVDVYKVARLLFGRGWKVELMEDGFWLEKDDAAMDLPEQLTFDHGPTYALGDPVVRLALKGGGQNIDIQAGELADEVWGAIRTVAGLPDKDETLPLPGRAVSVEFRRPASSPLPAACAITEGEAARMLSMVPSG